MITLTAVKDKLQGAINLVKDEFPEDPRFVRHTAHPRINSKGNANFMQRANGQVVLIDIGDMEKIGANGETNLCVKAFFAPENGNLKMSLKSDLFSLRTSIAKQLDPDIRLESFDQFDNAINSLVNRLNKTNDQVCKDLAGLMRSLTQRLPEDRPSLEQIQQHTFMSSLPRSEQRTPPPPAEPMSLQTSSHLRRNLFK